MPQKEEEDEWGKGRLGKMVGYVACHCAWQGGGGLETGALSCHLHPLLGKSALPTHLPLASRDPINKAFQLVTSTLNPLKAALLWAH